MLRHLGNVTRLHDLDRHQRAKTSRDVSRHARRLVDFRLLRYHLMLVLGRIAAKILDRPSVQSGRVRVEETVKLQMTGASSLHSGVRIRVHHSVEHHRHKIEIDHPDEMAMTMAVRRPAARDHLQEVHLMTLEGIEAQLTQSHQSRKANTESKLRTCPMTWDGKS